MACYLHWIHTYIAVDSMLQYRDPVTSSEYILEYYTCTRVPVHCNQRARHREHCRLPQPMLTLVGDRPANNQNAANMPIPVPLSIQCQCQPCSQPPQQHSRLFLSKKQKIKNKIFRETDLRSINHRVPESAFCSYKYYLGCNIGYLN